MNLLIGILLTVIGAVGAYFTIKNLSNIYGLMENNMLNRIGWLIRFGILLDIAFLTAGTGLLLTGVPVAEVLVPFCCFGLGAWFLLINPTRTKKVKKG